MSKTEGQADGKNVIELPQQANDSAKAVTDFVRDHPLLVVAGGVALGAIAARFLPRGTGRRIAKNAISLAELAGTAGAILGSRVRDTAEAAGEGLREQGGAVADRLGKFGEAASEQLGRFGGSASAQVESVAAKVAEKASELRSRVGR